MVETPVAVVERARILIAGLWLAPAVAACGAPPPESAGPSAVDWAPAVEVAAGDAHQGPWRMNRSDFRYVDDPTVALAADGSAVVAWVDQARKNVLLQRFDTGGTSVLEAPTDISRSPEVFSWLPKIALADSGRTVHVLWQEILFTGGSHGGEILYARSDDGGKSFGDPVNLSETTAGAGKGRLTRRIWHNGSLDLARAPDGTLIAAWTEYEGALRVSRSADGGGSFSAPEHVSGDARRPARGPSLAVAADGSVYLAWTVGEDAEADLRIARADSPAAPFDAPRAVHPGGGHADAPKLAVDASGRVHLAWAESPGGPGGAYRILYVRAERGNPEFGTPRVVSDALAGRHDSLSFPHLAIAGERVCLAFEPFPDRRRRPRGLGITCSGDGGETFPPAAEIPGIGAAGHGTSGGRQGLLMKKLALGPDGEIAAVHSTYRDGEASRVWLIRGR